MKQQVEMLKMDGISEGAYDVRAEESAEMLDGLAASIRRLGVLVPVIVCRAANGYVVVAGHRRVKAARRVGLGQIPCIIQEAGESQARETSLAENIFRQELSPVELAAAMNDILKAETMTIEQLAAAMHRTVRWVEMQISISSWPSDIASAVHCGYISVSAALNLVQIDDEPYRLVLLNTAMESGATARTTAAWLQAWRAAMPVAEAATAGPVPPGSKVPAVASYLVCIGCANEFKPGTIPFEPICPDCGTALREACRRSGPVR